MDIVEQNFQRRAMIEDVLLELMQETDYAHITVTDLAQHAGISRKSFYHYFQDKEACLLSLIDRILMDSALYVSEMLTDTEGYLHYYTAFLTYWKSKQTFLTAIIRSGLSHVVLMQIIKYISQEHKSLLTLLRLPTDLSEEGYEEVLFYASGCLSVLCSWAMTDCTTSVEVLAKKMVRMIHMPLLPPEGES